MAKLLLSAAVVLLTAHAVISQGFYNDYYNQNRFNRFNRFNNDDFRGVANFDQQGFSNNRNSVYNNLETPYSRFYSSPYGNGYFARQYYQPYSNFYNYYNNYYRNNGFQNNGFQNNRFQNNQRFANRGFTNFPSVSSNFQGSSNRNYLPATITGSSPQQYRF